MAAYLRSRRRRAGLTLDSLAERTGLTKSYLSKVERGIHTPSIAVALRIAHVLDTDVGQLFSDSPDHTLMALERHQDRTIDLEPAAPADYQALATRIIGKAMQPFIVAPSSAPATDYAEHAGDEFIFIHKGAVEVSLAEEVLTLNQGDSLYFDAGTPHRLRSTSPERAEVLVVVHDRDTPGEACIPQPGPGPTP